MNIAGLGPNGAIPQQDPATTNDVQVLDYSGTVQESIPAAESSTEQSVTRDHEKSRFSRIYDLIQEAEKRNKRGKVDRKKLRAILSYRRFAEASKESKGTLLATAA